MADRAAADEGAGVARSRAQLARLGFDWNAVRAQLDARRWRQVGRAIVLHHGPLDAQVQRDVALINCGPRGVLTSFTAAEVAGLAGWERPEVHVLVPRSARVLRCAEVPVIVHRAREWTAVRRHPAGGVHRLGPAVVLAAGSFDRPRPACAILAATVQQRLLRPDHLRSALNDASSVRHRAIMRAAVDDIAMGAQALSEIDFVCLCRRFALPRPQLQTVRASPGGRRRYLDVEWTRADGRRVVVEVDGALHLRSLDWVRDQLRQNEITLANSLVLRFPAVVVRTEPALVAHQLRRALQI